MTGKSPTPVNSTWPLADNKASAAAMSEIILLFIVRT